MGRRKSVWLFLLCAVLLLNTFSFQSVSADSETGKSASQKVGEIDYKSYVSQFDLKYDKLMNLPRNGLPVGNGKMGSLIYATDSELKYYLNRVDIFQSGSRGPAEADDCCTAGDVDINFGGSVFPKDNVSQHLSFYEAEATVAGPDVTASTIAWSDHDVMLVRVHDKRKGGQTITVDLKAVNPNKTEVKRLGDKIVLKQVFDVPSDTSIKENDHYNASAVVISVPDEDAAISVEDKKIRLTLHPDQKKYTVLMASASTFDRNEDVIQKALNELKYAEEQNYEKTRNSHTKWWREYWSKSFIEVDNKPELIEKWVTFFYYVGSSFRGDYPAKFNGSLWHVGPRAWGSQYWGFNQNTHYYALGGANHLELLQPLFKMTNKNLDKYAVSAVQQWGSKGIHISQTEAYNGPEILPDGIAADLRNVFLNQALLTPELNAFRKNRIRTNSRWNYPKNVENPNPVIGATSHWVADAGVIANFYWDQYLYTKDEKFLEEQAYPILKGVAEFYTNFPNLKKEADGKYHINYTNWAETLLGAKDVITDLAMMRGVLPVAIQTAEKLEVDADLVPHWKEVLDNLAPYPTSKMSDVLLAPVHPEGKTTYGMARKPIIKPNGSGTVWDWWLPQLYFFDNFTLESNDPDQQKVLEATLESEQAYNLLKKGELHGRGGFTWSRYLTEAAKMGRADIVQMGLPLMISQTKYWNDGSSPNRLPYVDGGYLSMQELGAYADSLQSPLLQSIGSAPGADPVIHVFPAWPKEWDTKFKMLAKGGFLVTSSIKDGEVEFIKLDSQIGGKVEIHNPWGNQPVQVIDQGTYKAVKVTSNGETVSFETKKGESYLLTVK